MRKWISAAPSALPPCRVVAVVVILVAGSAVSGAVRSRADEQQWDPAATDTPTAAEADPGEFRVEEMSARDSAESGLEEEAGAGGSEPERAGNSERERAGWRGWGYRGRGFREPALVSRDMAQDHRQFAGFGRGAPGMRGELDELDEPDIAHDDFPDPEEDPWALRTTANEGFVFIQGEYVTPPYQVDFRDDKVFINDLEINYPVPNYHPEYDRRWGMRRPGMSRRFNPVFMVVRELREGGAIVELPGQVSVSLNQPLMLREFLEYLASSPRAAKAPDILMDYLPPEQREPWNAWMRTFVPTTRLQEDVESYLTGMDSVESANVSSIAAVRRLDKYAYPLTVFGMICVVLAVGHLLQNRPADGLSSESAQLTPQTMRLVTRSMLLVIVLSGLDLAWTILASQAGQMRELNPLGSQLIQDPLALVLFKTSMTCMSVGLLFSLRKHRPAQVASWWACLICTLLTVRWLVFNSMFIA